MTELQKSILKTLNWFDIFDFPLTAKEIHQWLWHSQPESYAAVTAALKTLPGVSHHEGFYSLIGRTSITATRKERYLFAERKFKHAKWIIRIARMFPWVKMIAICNTLGYSNAQDDSDIDLFIITSAKRTWTTRLFIVGPMRVFHLRPLLERAGKDHDIRRDKIDATFFVDEHSLNLQPVAIEGTDMYLAYWLNTLMPIYDSSNYMKKLRAANTWTKKVLPNTIPYVPSYRRRLSKPNNLMALIFKIFSLVPESVARWFQLLIMPNTLKNLAKKKSTAVVISDNMLKFHDLDRRAQYRSEWLQRTQNI